MISDLGRSHLRPHDEGSSTEGVKGLGTFEYQPPEYWQDNGTRAKVKHGRAFDIWSMGCILIELATLAIHGWESGMIMKFRNERMNNLVPDRPELTKNRSRKDSSFHNNHIVVDDWMTHLKQHAGCTQIFEHTLDTTTAMMAREPRSRLYSWEAELDLHSAQGTGRSVMMGTVDVPIGLQSPSKCLGLNKLSNGAQTPLHRAALKEDHKRLSNLLGLGWPMFIQDEIGDTTLDIIRRSASKKFRDGFKSYTGQGIAAADVHQGTALLEASELGDTTKIRRFITEGK